MAAHATAIVLVRQDGADLAVRVQLGGKTISEQDGPDRAIGTEVVLLFNSRDAPVRFQLAVATVLNGVEPRFTVEQLSAVNPATRNAAAALSETSRHWLAGASVDAVLPWIESVVRDQPAASPLRGIAVNTYVDLLTRGGKSADVAEFLEHHLANSQSAKSATVDDLYLQLNLATAHWQLLQMERALTEIEAIAAIKPNPGTWQANAPTFTRRWLETEIRGTLGAIKIFSGRAQGNRRLVKEGAVAIAAALASIGDFPDFSMQGQLTQYLASYYMLELGRTNSLSERLHREAEMLYERAGDHVNLATIRNNQAYTELGRGNLESALRLYLETVELQKVSRQMEGKAHVRARLGYVYFTLGDYRRAEIRFNEAIAMYEDLKLPRKLIHNQLELAELLRAAGRRDEALTLLGNVKSKQAAELSPEDRLRLHTQIASICVERNDTDGAEQALRELGDLTQFNSELWPDLQTLIRVYYLLDFAIVRAQIDLTRNNLPAAKQRIEHALAWLGSGGGESLQQLQLLYLQMLIAEQQGRERQFILAGDRALAIIESVREKIDFHTQGPAWTARTSHINNLMVAHFLKRFHTNGNRQDLDRAFRQLETARARNLRDTRARNVNASESEVDAKSRKAMQAANQELIRALLLEQSAEQLEQRLAKAEERYQLDNAKKKSARTSVPILSVESIRKQLDANTQIRILFAYESSGFMVVATRNDLRVIELPGEDELKQLIEKVARELQLNRTEFPNARRLAKQLFPADDIPKTANMLIESDGIFAAIPFSVLLDLQTESAPATTVVTVPSLSELFASRAVVQPAGTSGRKGLVIFADPAFSLAAESSSNGSLNTLRSSMGRLPYTRVEAEAVSAFFPQGDFLSFIDTDASIDNVTGEPARNARILHIAAHGFASANDSLLLGLALANGSGNRSSGLLTVDHVNAVHYGNELVIISACESGRGQLLTGEGLMSVARAFLANGAKATLSTLWPVPDRANAEFMKVFYFALTRLHYDPAAALVYAQQQLKKNRIYQHPYYWGGFVLHVVDGGYQPVEAKVHAPRAARPSISQEPITQAFVRRIEMQ